MPKNPEKLHKNEEEPEEIESEKEQSQETTEELKEFRIEAEKSKVEEFKIQRNADTTIDLLKRFSPSEYDELYLNHDFCNKDAKELSQYLKDNKNKLSNEAKSFIHAIIEKNKFYNRPTETLDKEIISLSGKEAEQFKDYHKRGKLFKDELPKRRKIGEAFMQGHDKDKSEIIRMAYLEDDKFIEEYLNKNREELSPEAIAFLEMIKVDNTPEKNETIQELKKARKEINKTFEEDKSSDN